MTDIPAIKPLEWVEHGDRDFVWHRATPPIGFCYNIEDDGFSEKKHHLTVGQLVIGNFEALDEAKVAAQADFATRIRSCLLDKPGAVEGLSQDVINLIIAAREFWDVHNDLSPESRALDKALSGFASCVPFESEPDFAAYCAVEYATKDTNGKVTVTRKPTSELPEWLALFLNKPSVPPIWGSERERYEGPEREFDE